MTFSDAIKAGFQNWSNFHGRATRPEFWFFALFGLLGSILFMFSDLLSLLFSLFIIIPYLAVMVRRLHDTDRTGWWAAAGLVPVLGLIILIVLLIPRGTPGPNRFGDDPVTGETARKGMSDWRSDDLPSEPSSDLDRVMDEAHAKSRIPRTRDD